MLFTEEECKKIIEHSNTLKKKRQTPSADRFVSYEHCDLLLTDDTKWIYDRLNSYLETVTKMGVTKDVEKVMINRYIVGDGFEKHQDLYFKGQIFNVAVHLNNEYDGGDFVFYEPDYTMPKNVGESFVFENTRWHEIKKVTSGERWSMIAFYTLDNVKPKNKLM